MRVGSSDRFYLKYKNWKIVYFFPLKYVHEDHIHVNKSVIICGLQVNQACCWLQLEKINEKEIFIIKSTKELNPDSN